MIHISTPIEKNFLKNVKGIEELQSNAKLWNQISEAAKTNSKAHLSFIPRAIANPEDTSMKH